MTTTRRGFTLVELMTTVAVMGVLASIAGPRYQQIRKRANAAEIVTAMTTVRSAVYQFNETSGAWPATASLGAVPVGLDGYLPGAGVNLFTGPDHQLGWTATPVGPSPTQVVAASISDGTVCYAVYGLLGGDQNADLLGMCNAGGGFVFLWVDR